MKMLMFLLVALAVGAMSESHSVSNSASFTHNELEAINVQNIRLAPTLSSRVFLGARGGSKLTVTPSLLDVQLGWVTLSWEDISPATNDDWIGVYSPAISPELLSQQTPVKYQFANHSAVHVATGSGALNFTLLNMRDDYNFVMFSGGTTAPVAIAISNRVSFTPSIMNAPQQVHLSLADSSGTSMRVTWVSKNQNRPYVKYGDSDLLSRTAEALSSTYTSDSLCGPLSRTLGWRQPGFIHTAIMDNLLPSTTYFYRVGDAFGTSEVFSFVAPKVIDKNSNVRMVAYGDMGKGEIDLTQQLGWAPNNPPALNTSIRVERELDKQLDLVLHIGDISYAVGYAAVWDMFFAQVQHIASRVPYMVATGNHEADYPHTDSFFNTDDSNGECNVPYMARFFMPVPVTQQQREPWYSFNYGNIHFIVSSTEHDFRPESPQYRFVAADLAAVDRSKTAWVIFSGHRPMYIDSTWSQGEGADQPVAQLLRDSYERLFMEYEVDLALFGHHHSYQRTCAVYNHTCISTATKSNGYKAPVYLVIGMAGASHSDNLYPVTPQEFEVVNVKEYGYITIETSATVLRTQFLSDVDGSVLDELVINRQTAAPDVVHV
eukprot:GILK01003539.1.p1 GENE.GILK01003539.1~~GILK01003539.1.p1  ORF type:complete len:603 (+),score=98.53 GILK01003539.1:41-1849(+)